ncbi:MAG: hypothetical protein PVG27_05620 [Chloroflexota bacterium]|jgi:hypothetical protein
MNEETRSELACPVCGRNTLALDRPPEIDIMGVQQYSDMLGMGDLPNEGTVGIVCLSCDTHWRDKAAFDRGEPDTEDAADAADAVDLGGEDELAGDDERSPRDDEV